VKAYSIDIQISTHVASFIALPRFDSKQALHREIERIGKECHNAAQGGDSSRLSKLEARLDEKCAKVWEVSTKELAQMQDSLTPFNRAATHSEESDDD
jgi:hypothetical protein